MTRHLALIGALYLAATLLAQAQSADERYIWIYSLIQEADGFNEKGTKGEAARKYAEAQGLLKELQKLYPEFNPKVVNYRLGYIANQLETLAPQLPAGQVAGVPQLATNTVADATAPAKSITNAAPADTEQIKAMQGEIARLGSQNTLLQAKLKEALSVQPPGADPRDLAKAEEQIRALQKEKELLQSQVQQEQAKSAKLADPVVLEQERLLVVDIQKRLTRQVELNTALQEENATLKLRVEDLKFPAVLPANKASEQLEIAKNTISLLQATNIALRAEQTAMALRIAELSKAGTTNSPLVVSASSEGPSNSLIESLQRERDELRQQLAAARTNALPLSSGGMSAEELERQLKIARARLEAFEAQAIPYTPEELALFKQPDKKIEVATIKPAKKQQDLPAGVGQLVAEAQRAIGEGRLAEAEKKYQDVLRQDDNNTYTLVRLAAVQIEQNHLEEATKNVDKALKLDPDDALCLYLKGYLCVQQNNYDQALDALSLSAKILPQEARTQYLLGKVLLQKGMPAQAETALRKAIQLIPGYREAHYTLALVYSKQKPPLKELAQWHYRKATALGYPADPALEKQLQEAPAVSSTK